MSRVYYYLPFPPSPPKPVSLCAAFLLVFSGPTPSFLLPSSTLTNDALQRCASECRLACTPLFGLLRYRAPLCVSVWELGPWTVFVSLQAQDSHSQRLLVNSVLTSLSPSPLSFCPGPAASHPHSNVIFFYDSSTKGALPSPFLSSVLSSVATVLCTTWLTILSPSYLDFNYEN